MSLPAVSVVVPTFNGGNLLKKHIPALLHAMREADELILVDDASTDDTKTWVADELTGKTRVQPNWHSTERTANSDDVVVMQGKLHGKRTLYLRLKKNVRFAVAVNTGVALAGNPLVFLLNNDVAVREDTIKHLAERFNVDGTGSLFAVGCLEIEGVSGQLGGKNTLRFERGLFQHSRASDFSSGATAWASGGSAMFSVEKWLELGGFDPRFYPAYWEDVDLSFRARKLGWRVEFNEQAVVEHLHETTNSTVFGAKKLQRQSFKHQRLFTKIHATVVQRLLYYIWWPYWRIVMRRVWS